MNQALHKYERIYICICYTYPMICHNHTVPAAAVAENTCPAGLRRIVDLLRVLLCSQAPGPSDSTRAVLSAVLPAAKDVFSVLLCAQSPGPLWSNSGCAYRCACKLFMCLSLCLLCCVYLMLLLRHPGWTLEIAANKGSRNIEAPWRTQGLGRFWTGAVHVSFQASWRTLWKTCFLLHPEQTLQCLCPSWCHRWRSAG